MRSNGSPRPAGNWLVTGAAGFIGMHTCWRLLDRGARVVGVDNINDYYDISLKQARLSKLQAYPNFEFHRENVANDAAINEIFKQANPTRVIHLAAQAGVRYSLTNARACIESNIEGFANVLEACRQVGVGHLVYASSSSVYGGNGALPFSEHQNVDHPLSLYAATKRANELMAHTYSHLYGLPTTGLRFFTAYGPWGRPDMALFSFTKAILAGEPIDMFNNGNMVRDFTYVDDIVEGVVLAADRTATANIQFDPKNPDPASSNAPYRIFNIGSGLAVPLAAYVSALEEALGFEARKNYLPMQPGDVHITTADVTELSAWTGFVPKTTVREGIANFVAWYRNYYHL